MNETKEIIRSFILSEFLPGEAASNLGDDLSLRSSGVLDSLATLKLVTFIEERFRINVEAYETGVDNFDRINDIAAFVERKLRGE